MTEQKGGEKKKLLFGISKLSWWICLGVPVTAFAAVYFLRGSANVTALFVMVMAMLVCARTVEGVVKDIKARRSGREP